MKALYLGLPAVGHVTPALRLVKSLQEDGQSITFYCSEQFREAFEEMGVEFRAYPDLRDNHKGISYGLLALGKSLLYVTKQQMPFLIEEVKRHSPDYLIYDSVAPWGKCLAQVTGLPAVCIVTTPVINPEILASRRRFGCSLTSWLKLFEYLPGVQKNLRHLNKNYRYGDGFSGLFSNTAELNIVFTSRILQADAEKCGDNYSFIGAQISSSIFEGVIPDSKEKEGQPPIIYVSMGTIESANIHFMNEILSLLEPLTQFEFIVSLGGRLDEFDFGNLPGHIKLFSFVEQAEVLKTAKVFVSHGGQNSVNESLCMGVPLLILPSTDERQLIAQEVEKQGAALSISTNEIKRSDFSAYLSRLVEQTDFRLNAIRLGQILRKAGGLPQARKDISAYLARKSTHEQSGQILT